MSVASPGAATSDPKEAIPRRTGLGVKTEASAQAIDCLKSLTSLTNRDGLDGLCRLSGQSEAVFAVFAITMLKLTQQTILSILSLILNSGRLQRHTAARCHYILGCLKLWTTYGQILYFLSLQLYCAVSQSVDSENHE